MKASKESALYSPILQLLAMRGILAWRNNSTGIFDPQRKVFRSFQGLRGTSDIIGVLPVSPTNVAGRALFIEVKGERGKLSDHQSAFLAAATARGALAFVARSLRDVDEALFRERYA